MNFALSRIAAAVGLTMAASAAMALPAGFTPNTPLTDFTSGAGVTDVYLAGSSAVDLALTKFIANSCADGTMDAYRTDAGGKTYYLWTCVTSATSGFNLTSGNTHLAIHKNTNSSSDGVNGVINGAAPFAFLQVSDLTPATACPSGPVAVPATATVPTYNSWVCGTTAGAAGVGTLSANAQFGFSDSEPAQFNAAHAGEVTSVEPLTIIFGIPVSTNVRNALQAQQGLTVGGEGEADMPTLSTGDINAIYTGRLKSWSQIGLTIGADNNIYWARRSGGSGTTRAFDATFIGDICIPGVTAIANAAAAPGTSAIPTTCTAVGSGGAQSAQLGTSDDMAACVASYGAAGVGAIGYLSTDYQPKAADGYRWIKVDGYSPKQLNVANGKWRDWSEEALNYNTLGGAPAGDLKAFYTAIQLTSKNTGLLSEVSSSLTQTTSGLWTGGIMGALNTSANSKGAWGVAPTAILSLPRTDASVLAAPANPATHAGSTGYNLCNFPQQTLLGYQPQ